MAERRSNISARRLADRPALLVLRRPLGRARPAGGGADAELRPGVDQCPAQFLAQRFLQHVAGIRSAGILPADRHIRGARLAGLIFSLVGQHYYLTLKHSVKKQNLEPQIRQYAEKNLRAWSEKNSQGSFRAKLFKPIRPWVERWAKWLNKKAAAAQKENRDCPKFCVSTASGIAGSIQSVATLTDMNYWMVKQEPEAYSFDDLSMTVQPTGQAFEIIRPATT